MKPSRIFKTEWFFMGILFVFFICFMLVRYSNYPYFPPPPPNQFPQAFTAPAPTQ